MNLVDIIETVELDIVKLNVEVFEGIVYYHVIGNNHCLCIETSEYKFNHFEVSLYLFDTKDYHRPLYSEIYDKDKQADCIISTFKDLYYTYINLSAIRKKKLSKI